MKVFNTVFSGSGNSIKYYNIENVDPSDLNFMGQVGMVAMIGIVSMDGMTGCSFQFYHMALDGAVVLAIGIMFDAEISLGKRQTVREYLEETGHLDDLLSYPELTEEEFYNLLS